MYKKGTTNKARVLASAQLKLTSQCNKVHSICVTVCLFTSTICLLVGQGNFMPLGQASLPLCCPMAFWHSGYLNNCYPTPQGVLCDYWSL